MILIILLIPDTGHNDNTKQHLRVNIRLQFFRASFHHYDDQPLLGPQLDNFVLASGGNFLSIGGPVNL